MPSPDDEQIPLAKNSVKLFDGYRSTFAYQLDVGPIWTRRASETTVLSRREGFKHMAPGAGEISLGGYVTTPSEKGPFYLASEYLTTFRVLDSKSFSWAIVAQKFGGGVALGPIEIDGKVGIDALSVDIMHAQPSIQLLSPMVEAGVGIHLGKIRLDIKGTLRIFVAMVWAGLLYPRSHYRTSVRSRSVQKSPPGRFSRVSAACFTQLNLVDLRFRGRVCRAFPSGGNARASLDAAQKAGGVTKVH